MIRRGTQWTKRSQTHGLPLMMGLLMIFVGGCMPKEEVERELAQQAAEKAAAERQTLPPDRVAGAGVGIQGRSLEGGSEYNPATFVSGPAAAYFRAKEKIVFEIQIPQAVNLYVAQHGRHPRSHEEFMREIVESNRIPLPKLPEGMVYRYHTDTNELWTEAEKSESTTSEAPGSSGP